MALPTASNPYLQQQGDALAQQYNNNLTQNVLPNIRSGAIAAGGFGGSRQGIAEGLGIGQSQQALSGALAGMYGNAYESDQNRAMQQAMQQAQLASNQQIAGMQNDTQRYGLDKNYNINLGQLGLGQYNAETSRNLGFGQLAQQGDQNAFNNQLNAAQLQLAGLGAQQNWNNQGVNLANQQQQLPLQNLGLLSNIGIGIGGQGGSMSQPGASTIGSALGGALTLSQLYKLLGGG